MRNHFPHAVFLFRRAGMCVCNNIFGNVTSKIKRVTYANIYLAKFKEKVLSTCRGIYYDEILLRMCCINSVLKSWDQ